MISQDKAPMPRLPAKIFEGLSQRQIQGSAFSFDFILYLRLQRIQPQNYLEMVKLILYPIAFREFISPLMRNTIPEQSKLH